MPARETQDPDSDCRQSGFVLATFSSSGRFLCGEPEYVMEEVQSLDGAAQEILKPETFEVRTRTRALVNGK